MSGRPYVVIMAVLAVSGCASTAVPGSPPTPTGKSFVSVSVTENGKPHTLAPGTAITLRFTDDGRVVASAGCNTFSGYVTLTDGKIEAPQLTSTEMGCDDARDQQDQWLAGILGNTPSWRMTADQLVVTSPTTTLTLTGEKQASLTGTAWRLDTLIDGQTATQSNPGESLTFDDGVMTISGGCLNGTVHYEVAGSTIQFDHPKTTIAPCTFADANAAGALLDVVHGTVTYKIDGQALTLTMPTGKGLGFRA